MTVKQLKSALDKYPDNMNVFMAERKTEFTYGLLNSVSSQEISFTEDSDMSFNDAPELGEEELPLEMVVILDEE